MKQKGRGEEIDQEDDDDEVDTRCFCPSWLGGVLKKGLDRAGSGWVSTRGDAR
jgi:hypothetical protein